MNEETPDQEKPAKTGVLEVNIKGEWHQVCAEGWTEANSNVACGHLGYTHALVSIDLAYFMLQKTQRFIDLRAVLWE